MNQNIPDPLLPVLDVIEESPRTTLSASWSQDAKRRWFLGISAKLSVEPSQYMPADSSWYVVVEGERPRPKVTIYPASFDGITTTFHHQSANLAGPPGSPWRLGNPCVERPEATFKRDEVAEEPTDLSDRIIWRIGRLLDWIDAAATGTLLHPGDALELPSFNATSTPVMGFVEKPEQLDDWRQRIGTWGFAKTAAVQGAISHRQVTDYLGQDFVPVKTDVQLPEGSNNGTDAIWLMVPSCPVVAPWQSPSTWRELAEVLGGMGVNLGAIVRDASRQLRSTREYPPSRLLLGFPLEQRIGERADRVHWLAAEKLGLSDNQSRRNGFRPTEKNRRYFDEAKAASLEPIKWIKSNNWASDQLRTRGNVGEAVSSRRVLIIGAGAIGSALAENLVRSGVRQVGVVDGDLVEVGNLCRHTLGISDAGHGKADAVAARLGRCGPDIEATKFQMEFPPSDPKMADAMAKYDIVVDCTGSDAVLEALARFDWKGEKLFVSVSIGWGAKEFFCYAASETTFPVIDALDRFSKSMSFRPDMKSANREGIGCWHPVFPATSDDIQLWSAVGAKFIRRVVSDPRRRCSVYRLADDGTVSVVDG